MKNWKKGKNTSDTQYYIHVPSKDKPFKEQKTLAITKLDKNRGYVVFLATGEDYKAIQKEFKTEKSAMKYAKSKMRSAT